MQISCLHLQCLILWLLKYCGHVLLTHAQMPVVKLMTAEGKEVSKESPGLVPSLPHGLLILHNKLPTD